MHLRPIWKDYYASCHAVLFVCDESQCNNRMAEITSELSRMDADSQLAGAPLMIVYNYQTERPTDDLVDELRDKLHVGKLKRQVFVCALNAYSGKGLHECFTVLLNELKNNARDINEDDFV